MNALKRWLPIAALIVLIAALVRFHLIEEAEITTLLAPAFPGAEISRVQSDVEAYKVVQEERTLWVYPTHPTGWGGPMVVAPVVGPDFTIKNILVLKHRETPAFFDYVKVSGLLDGFQGKTHTAPLTLGQDTDAVSGATITSRAITRGVRQAMDHAAGERLGLEIPERKAPIHFGRNEALLLLLFALTLVAAKKRWRKMRLPIMAAAFLFLGPMTKSPVSISQVAALAMGHAPSVSEHLFWWILVAGSFLLVGFLGKNVWCGWLCPFGAIQEGISRTGGLKLSPPAKLRPILKMTAKVVAFGALLAAFLTGNAAKASVEPFATLFGLKGEPWQWYLVSLAITGAFLIPRFWCRFFCPAGVCFDCAAKAKRSCRKAMKK